MRPLVVFIVLAVFGAGLFEIWRTSTFAKLRVAVETTGAENSTPVLRNDSIIPALVERCTYTTDTNKPGETFAYNIDKWDHGRGTWVRAFEFAVRELCSPMPTSHGGTKWEQKVLWHGERIEGWSLPLWHFQKGDIVRVVAITGITSRGASFASQPIRVR